MVADHLKNALKVFKFEHKKVQMNCTFIGADWTDCDFIVACFYRVAHS